VTPSRFQTKLVQLLGSLFIAKAIIQKMSEKHFLGNNSRLK